MKPTLTEADERALRVLVTCMTLVRPQHFGELLWPSQRRAGNCSAPFARPAGRVLNRLKAAGLAEYLVHKDEWGWTATAAGRRYTEER